MSKSGILKKHRKGSGQPPHGEVMKLIAAAQNGNESALNTLYKKAKRPGWRIAISECARALFSPEPVKQKIRTRLKHQFLDSPVMILKQSNTYKQIIKCRHCDNPAIPGDDVCYQHIK